jgi:hypothetical protein
MGDFQSGLAGLTGTQASSTYLNPDQFPWGGKRRILQRKAMPTSVAIKVLIESSYLAAGRRGAIKTERIVTQEEMEKGVVGTSPPTGTPKARTLQ